ncbi:Mur ligase domain-containing protein [Streptomyces eurythermus]
MGICGAGMSALAHLLAGRGAQVSGSDLRMGKAATGLETAGCRVRSGHGAANIAGASVVVWSSVIDAANPEISAAGAAGTPVAHRSHVLAQLMAAVDRSVVVAGTHGKTTATMRLAAAVGHLHPSWVASAAPVGCVNGHNGSGLLIAIGPRENPPLAGAAAVPQQLRAGPTLRIAASDSTRAGRQRHGRAGRTATAPISSPVPGAGLRWDVEGVGEASQHGDVRQG